MTTTGRTAKLRSKRLQSNDRDTARALFTLMAEVFEERREDLSDSYVDRLLAREDFWAIAAFAGDQVIGGLTAHTLPMTKAQSSEIFIYDIAVRRGHQRTGVGKLLVAELRALASAAGIHEIFVCADSEDAHALDFYRALGASGSSATMFTLGDRGP